MVEVVSEAEFEDETEDEVVSEAVTDWLEIPGRCWHSHRSSRDCCWDSPSQVLLGPSSWRLLPDTGTWGASRSLADTEREIS